MNLGSLSHVSETGAEIVNGTGIGVCWEQDAVRLQNFVTKEDSGIKLPSLVFGCRDFRKNVVGHLSEGRGEGAL